MTHKGRKRPRRINHHTRSGRTRLSMALCTHLYTSSSLSQYAMPRGALQEPQSAHWSQLCAVLASVARELEPYETEHQDHNTWAAASATNNATKTRAQFKIPLTTSEFHGASVTKAYHVSVIMMRGGSCTAAAKPAANCAALLAEPATSRRAAWPETCAL